jgi:hypothetical protein
VGDSAAPPGATGTNTWPPVVVASVDQGVISVEVAAVVGRWSAVVSAVGATVGSTGGSLRQAARQEKQIMNKQNNRCIGQIICDHLPSQVLSALKLRIENTTSKDHVMLRDSDRLAIIARIERVRLISQFAS